MLKLCSYPIYCEIFYLLTPNNIHNNQPKDKRHFIIYIWRDSSGHGIISIVIIMIKNATDLLTHTNAISQNIVQALSHHK